VFDSDSRGIPIGALMIPDRVPPSNYSYYKTIVITYFFSCRILINVSLSGINIRLSANSLSPPIVQVVTTVDEGCDDEQQSLAKYMTLKPPSAIRRLISTCRPLSNFNL
jgi:hypothetical protein